MRLVGTVNAVNNDAKTYGYVAVFMDVTQQKRAERALRQHAATLDTVLMTAPLGLLMVDANGIITLARGQCVEQLAQAHLTSLPGRAIDEAFRHVPRLLVHYKTAHEGRALSEVLEYDDLVLDVHYAQQQENGVLVVMLDVADRHAADQTLQRYAIRLETLRQIDEAILALQGTAAIATTTLDYLPFLCPYIAGAVYTMSDQHRAELLAFRHQAGTVSAVHNLHIPLDYFHRAANLNTPVHTDLLADTTAHNPLDAFFAQMGAAELITTPLVYHNELIGMLVIGIKQSISGGSTLHETYEVMEEISRVLALAIKQARLSESIKQYTESLEADFVNIVNDEQIARNRSDAVLQSSSDAIALTDETGSILQVNPAFLQLFGGQQALAAADVLEHPLEALALERERPRLKQLLQHVVETQEARRFTVLMTRRGTTFDADIAISPIPNIYSDIDGLVINLRDVTEAKKAEEDLRSALERERELSELRSRFVSTVSHEFRTPLTVIQSSTDLLEMYVEQANIGRGSHHIERVKDSVTVMKGLLEDVISLQHAEAINQLQNVVELAPLAVTRTIIENVQLASGGTHTINLHSTDAAPTMQANEKLFRQIISNLVTNAVKYSPVGSTVQVSIHTQGEEIIIEVVDEGIGIPPRAQAHIFEPFYRADNADPSSGTGLGLAIVKRAVDLHGGTISLHSTEDGTQFRVVLPLRQQSIVVQQEA